MPTIQTILIINCNPGENEYCFSHKRRKLQLSTQPSKSHSSTMKVYTQTDGMYMHKMWHSSLRLNLRFESQQIFAYKICNISVSLIIIFKLYTLLLHIIVHAVALCMHVFLIAAQCSTSINGIVRKHIFSLKYRSESKTSLYM